MKTKSSWLALPLVLQTMNFAHAGALQTVNVSSFLSNSCWYEPSAPYTASGTFTLPGVSGTGTVNSALFYAIQSYSSGGIYRCSFGLHKQANQDKKHENDI